MTLKDIIDDNLSVHINTIASHSGLAESLQSKLVDLGILDPPVDGKFGPVSRLAVQQFVTLTGVGDPELIEPTLAKALLEADAGTLLPLTIGTDPASRVVACLQKKGYWFARLPGYVNIVYVEGADDELKPNGNPSNHFNDRRLLITTSNGAPKIIGNWQATSEPGKFFTQHPVHSLGAGRVNLGQFKAWGVGTHHPPSGHGAHEALVQNRSIEICRDRDKNFERTGDFIDTNNDGFNQHHGFNQPPNDIGHASAGCLVGRTIDGHKQFMALVKSDPRYQASNGYLFYTTIVEAADLP